MSARPHLEVRIPISPTQSYFNRVHFIAHSIRSLGDRYSDALVRVTVGADQEPEDLYERLPWSRAAGIKWHWVDRGEFAAWRGTAHPYIATMMERFRPPFSGTNVLMLDADVVAMRPFDELFDTIAERPGVVGVMAHVSPFIDPHLNHAACWRHFYALSSLGEPCFEFQHSGWELMDADPSRRLSPPYFNTGVLMAPAKVLEHLYPVYMSMVNEVRANMDTYYVEQIALTLALMRTGIGFHVVPVRYNFPNDPKFDGAYRQELDEVRLLHFLRTEIISREADFDSPDATLKLIRRRDLTGSNEEFRLRIEELLPLVLRCRQYYSSSPSPASHES